MTHCLLSVWADCVDSVVCSSESSLCIASVYDEDCGDETGGRRILDFFLNQGLKCICLFLEIQENWLNSEVHHSAEERLTMKKCWWKEWMETDEMISSKCQSVSSFMANACTITVQCGCLLSKVKFTNKGQSLFKGVVVRVMRSVAVLMTCVKSGVYNVFRPGIDVTKSYC